MCEREKTYSLSYLLSIESKNLPERRQASQSNRKMWTIPRATKRLNRVISLNSSSRILLSENKNVMILNNSFATASKKKKKKTKDASSSGASLGRAISQEDIQMHLEMVDPQKRVEV